MRRIVFLLMILLLIGSVSADEIFEETKEVPYPTRYPIINVEFGETPVFILESNLSYER